MNDGPAPARPWRRGFVWVLGALLALVIAIQFVPYGWTHSNPPVIADAPWPDEQSAEIARESCDACHSNETEWPAYSYVAPMSWLVRRDVDSGRDELNFSTWPDDAGELDDSIEQIEEGGMPPSQYTLIHRGAALTEDEQQTLIEALRTMERQERDGRG